MNKMGVGESDKIGRELKDFYGNPLKNRIYFAGNGRVGNFYIIKLNEDGTKFSVRDMRGPVILDDEEDNQRAFITFAAQLIPLNQPKSNLEFALAYTLRDRVY